MNIIVVMKSENKWETPWGDYVCDAEVVSTIFEISTLKDVRDDRKCCVEAMFVTRPKSVFD